MHGELNTRKPQTCRLDWEVGGGGLHTVDGYSEIHVLTGMCPCKSARIEQGGIYLLISFVLLEMMNFIKVYVENKGLFMNRT